MAALASGHFVIIFLLLVFLLAFVTASLLVIVWHEGFDMTIVTFLVIAGVSLVSAFFLLMSGKA